MRRLSGFTTLVFDCYGTLIDWEAGILYALRPALGPGLEASDDELLERFAEAEQRQERQTPSLPYRHLLGRVYARLAESLDLPVAAESAERFGASVGDWPAFPDSAEALAYLKRHYRLAALSNVDRQSFVASGHRLGDPFDAVFTAEEIGSYKPDPRNFEYALRRLGKLGVERTEILHTAQSLFHDIEPASRLGLATCWIDRRHGKPGFGATAAPSGATHPDFRFTGMAELARAHREGTA